MSPSPFLSPFIVNWLAAQAASHIEREVVDELKSRAEKGNLGDYDGILFKNSIKSKKRTGDDSDEDSRSLCADVGIVGAVKQELVGIFDKMGVPKTTKGDGFTYYTGSWNGKKIAIVQAGVGATRARKATDALIQVFQPERIVSAGFAAGLVSSLKSGAVVVPNRLIREDGSALDLAPRRLTNATSDANLTENTENTETTKKNGASEDVGAAPSGPMGRFATGTLLTVDRIVVAPSEKKRLGKETGAAILDMETWAVAEVCGARGVPFLPLRVVFDAADESLPREVQNVVDSSQSAARLLGAFFGAVAKRPSSALDIYKLKERSLIAADKLAAALETIFAAFP